MQKTSRLPSMLSTADKASNGEYDLLIQKASTNREWFNLLVNTPITQAD
jgi:hypothetical protein